MNKKCFISIMMVAAIGWGTQATAQEEGSLLDRRLEEIKGEKESRWLIKPFRPNYVLPVTFLDNPNERPLADGQPADTDLSGVETDLDDVEIKFQFSFALPLVEDLVANNGDLLFAYTQVSYWQAYNEEASSPFRDSNYEPEFMLLFDTDTEVLGLKNRQIMLGLVHQSNGRGNEILTRSWNRVYANLLFEKGDFVLSFKPWLRISNDDDNPNIDKYMGYGELRGIYQIKEHQVGAMVRNNLRADNNRGALELNWTFPMYQELRGIVQFFNGYGENLLDYNVNNTRIGFGVMMSDWL